MGTSKSPKYATPEDEESTASTLLNEMLRKGAEPTDGPMWPPSEAQVRYVLGLQEERVLPPEYTVQTAETIRLREKDQVSRAINTLKTYPFKEPKGRGRTTKWTMPEGRYCLEDEDGTLNFLQVDKPTTGRWKGYVFIKRLVGSPGDYRQVNVAPDQRGNLLTRIQDNPEKASIRFGKETHYCGRCHSPLTRPESRAAGIGPYCAAKEW